MLGALIPFLSNKWTRLGVEVALIAALALGIRAYFLAEGKRQGKDEAAQSQQQELAKAREQDRKDMQAVIDKASASVNAAELQRRAADATLLQLAGVLSDLAKRQSAGETKVAGLSDSQLRPYIIGQLGIRPPGDATPGYTPAEERALSSCVTQYPICKAQLEASGKQVGAEQSKTASADQIAAANQVMVKGQKDFIASLDDKFNQLYNLHPPKYRSAKCLWLWRCGVKKIATVQP